jgi:hypothetical protein
MAENEDSHRTETEVIILDTSVPETDVTEPDWYRNGKKWVKIFLEPIAPGKFKQFDYIYNVPGKNEFPKERWNAKECRDGFHITRRRYVQSHLSLHDYKSVYIAEVVSHGDEFYDNPGGYKRKVRVVTFGPAVPLADVLGKHPGDFEYREMFKWSVLNNHLELLKLVFSKKTEKYDFIWAFEFSIKKGNGQIADFLIGNFENYDLEKQTMLYNAIQHGRVDFVKRLMENTSVNVSIFKWACEHGQFEIFQLLCAKYGEPKCSDIILDALRGGNVKILGYIKSRGVDMSDFGMFVYACTNYVPIVETVKYLISEGADVKHPLIAYIAKRYAYTRKGVREYLLTQIDVKSEVPWCLGFEEEILEIRTDFHKRMGSGEFDRVSI